MAILRLVVCTFWLWIGRVVVALFCGTVVGCACCSGCVLWWGGGVVLVSVVVDVCVLVCGVREICVG